MQGIHAEEPKISISSFAAIKSRFLAQYIGGKPLPESSELDSPTPEELELLIAELPRYFSTNHTTHRLIKEKLLSYRFQCVVVISSGHRLLYSSALQDPTLEWRKHVITTNDGDEASWRTIFDLRKRRIIHFSVNGPTVYLD